MRRVSWPSILFLSLCVCVGLCHASSSPLGFPLVQDWSLQSSTIQFSFTGESQRKLLFLRIYDVAHYVGTGASVSSAQEILQQDINRQLSIRYRHNIPASRLRSVLRDGFELNSTEGEWLMIQDKVEKLLAKINRNAKPDDELIIRWLADNRVMFFLNGSLIAQTKHEVFARVLWSIWLGPHSVVKLRELISTIVNDDTAKRLSGNYRP